MNSFFSQVELEQIGFGSLGKNVLLSRKTSIYGAHNIYIGSDVRIDDFCVLSGKISFGNFVHVAAFCAIYGGEEGVEIHDFVGLSSRVSMYAVSDDFTGESLTNPMVSNDFRNVISRKVTLEKHVIIGSGCVILPGVTLRIGSAFGALSLINKNSKPWTINRGTPAKTVCCRSTKILELERAFLSRRSD